MATSTPPFSTWIRFALALCAIALIIVLFVPMWRIELDAPQYPEGLVMLIYSDNVGGNVDIINGLNHYIGMKTIHKEDFPEFVILPWIIKIFAGLFFLAAIVRKRAVLYSVFGLFVIFGVLAMIDFWNWEYEYGHNLDPNAAIVVPGMAYQPPLIGFKQLLNFGAYSIPDTGGWLFIGVGLISLLVIAVDYMQLKKFRAGGKLASVVGLVLVAGLTSCSNGPQKIKLGTDECAHCKMTLSNARFGTELVTKKGRVYFFDDTNCLASYLKKNQVDSATIQDLYFVDFCGNHDLIPLSKAEFIEGDNIKSPMGGNVAVFSNSDSLAFYANKLSCTPTNWTDIKNK